jgi:hypothetical protein
MRLDRYHGGNVQNCDVWEIARFYLVLVDFYKDGGWRMEPHGSTALLGK